MSGKDPAREIAEAEAAERLSLILSGEASVVDRAEVEAWRTRDPANAEAWARISAIWDASAASAEDPLIREMRAAALQRTGTGSMHATQHWRPLALAASLLLAVSCAWWVFGSGDIVWQGRETRIASGAGTRWAPDIRTRVGEIRSVHLQDGSLVTLNTDSLLRTAVSNGARRIKLDRGEAYFEVAKDESRPFVVATNGLTITALGTAFSVRNTGEAAVVALAEGRVRVVDTRTRKSLTMTPGFELHADANGVRVERMDTRRTLSWVSGMLDFEEAPLARVVDEVNRYARNPLIISDHSLADRKISGVFPTDPDRFVAMLASTYQIRVRRIGNRIELSGS